MAEFTVVIKEIGRMCATIGDCKGCNFRLDNDCKLLAALDENDVSLDQIAEIERIVMDWAEKHPEPRYPTWAEAWRQLFPAADLIPCPRKHFGFSCACIDEDSCQTCVNRQMYPFIAKKLGIKPIGGASDENA